MFGFGATGTLAVLGTRLALIITAAAAPAALRRVRWQYAAARNYTRYRAAVVAEHSPRFQMPGVLAPPTLLDAEDGYGGRGGRPEAARPGIGTGYLRSDRAGPGQRG